MRSIDDGGPGPIGEGVQVGVDNQAPGLTENEQNHNGDDGRSNASNGHVLRPDVGISGDQSVRRSAHRQVEGHAAGQTGGQDQVKWMNLNGQSLEWIG